MTISHRSPTCRRGWTDEQDGGHYRLARRDDEALFGYAVGPHSWKKFLHPPVQRLWRADARRRRRACRAGARPAERFAFIGVRSCELHAIAIQDRVFLGGAHVDPHYRARREERFHRRGQLRHGRRHLLLRLDEHRAEGDGRVRPRADRALRRGRALCSWWRSGTELGDAILAELPQRAATEAEVAAAEQIVAHTAASMGREMPSGRPPRASSEQSRASALERRGGPLPHLRQLHDGVSDLLLHLGRGLERSRGTRDIAFAALGFLLHHGLLLHPRRQRASDARGRATGSG